MTEPALAGFLGALSARAVHGSAIAAGMAEARAAGRRLGRPRITDDQVQALARAFADGAGVVRAARAAGCSAWTAGNYRRLWREGRLPV